MKVPRARHRWDLSPRAAAALQARLAGQVICAPLPRPPRLVAGGDIALSPDARELVAAWLVWDVSARQVIETAWTRRRIRFPYVPGLLSFREAPGMLAAARKLRCEPDAFMLDGQGFAHPRRFGLACHLGWLLDRPAVGCAKSLLCGRFDTPGQERGASKPLLDGTEVIGRVVRTQAGISPVYVSIGHRIELMQAVRLVLACCTQFRLPEPTRRAHQFVTRTARMTFGCQALDAPKPLARPLG